MSHYDIDCKTCGECTFSAATGKHYPCQCDTPRGSFGYFIQRMKEIGRPIDLATPETRGPSKRNGK